MPEARPSLEVSAGDDLLRALPDAEIDDGSQALPSAEPGEALQLPGEPAAAAAFTIRPRDEPQEKRTKFFATDSRTGAEFYVGQIAVYGTRRGISRRSDALMFDRHAAANDFGDWAHFIWPTVMGESGGQQVVINAWDRAHFTWGFYQLAAHTPDDNLILLLRELVQLPSAKTFFPDLFLEDGQLAQSDGSSHGVTLEMVTTVPVGSGSEKQIVDFMTYLNPSSKRLDEREVVTCAKFIAWATEDPQMLATTTRVSIDIMKRKIKSRAGPLGLTGKRPELAIWVSDIFHHGRGTRALVEGALGQPSFSKQLKALSEVDRTGEFAKRRATVAAAVETLIDEKRFDGVAFGSGSLAL